MDREQSSSSWMKNPVWRMTSAIGFLCWTAKNLVGGGANGSGYPPSVATRWGSGLNSWVALVPVLIACVHALEVVRGGLRSKDRTGGGATTAQALPAIPTARCHRRARGAHRREDAASHLASHRGGDRRSINARPTSVIGRDRTQHRDTTIENPLLPIERLQRTSGGKRPTASDNILDPS